MTIFEQQVRTFYSEIWDKQNFDEIPNVLNADFVFRGSLGQEKKGFDGFKEYVLSVHAALSHYRCLIDDLVVEPNKVFAKMTFNGIHTAEFLGYAATNMRVTWAGAALFKFTNGKVTSLWVLGDLKTLEQQLEYNRSLAYAKE